jgi:hypothetical protein
LFYNLTSCQQSTEHLNRYDTGVSTDNVSINYATLLSYRPGISCANEDKKKCKVHPITGHEGPDGEWRYSSTLSLTSAQDWGVGD